MATVMNLEPFDRITHGDVSVSPETYGRFSAALPADVCLHLPIEKLLLTLGDVADAVRDYMSGYVYRCQRRPALPHEREEGDGGFYLTKKGTARYNERLKVIASAFEETFGYSVVHTRAWGPVGGPLDPLTYD